MAPRNSICSEDKLVSSLILLVEVFVTFLESIQGIFLLLFFIFIFYFILFFLKIGSCVAT